MREDELDRYDLEYGDFTEEPRTRPRKPRREETSPDIAEIETEDSLLMTYHPSRFERTWLASSLRTFYQQEMIQDVLSHVKGGKEASVYCCEAHPITGEELIAAKVYRPRQFRNLRNDAMYREGRPLLTGEGRAVKATDNRILRAVNKKSDFGVQVQHTSWLLYEYTTLGSLFSAGAAVPKPYGVSDNAILMGYQGDRQTPARTLSEVALEREEAEVLYQEVVRNMELMLAMDVIHGDLSAYNILYWQGKITLIDFPQVTNVLTNQNAAFILKRDIVRVCDYFARLGVPCDAESEFERLWKPYQKLREIENALALP